MELVFRRTEEYSLAAKSYCFCFRLYYFPAIRKCLSFLVHLGPTFGTESDFSAHSSTPPQNPNIVSAILKGSVIDQGKN